VLYAIVFDADGRVAAHSRRPDRVGHPLEDPLQARVLAASGPLTQETVLPGGDHALYDFAVPIVVESQRWGTIRVGLSKRRMEAAISRTRIHLLALTIVTLVLGAGAAAVVARRIAQPVRQLAAGA